MAVGGIGLRIIPACLIAGGLLLAGYGVGQFAGGATPARLSAASTGTPDVAQLEKQFEEIAAYRDNLKDRLDLISQQGTHALWLLSAVLVVAGFLTAAQSYFALLSAQSYVKQMEDAIQKIQTRFPLFADIESARAQAFDELSNLSRELDQNQNLYGRSGPLIRQRILAIESFSAVQFLTPATRAEDRVRNLRLLGKFYASKFYTDALAIAAQPLAADFERAQYYFDMASHSQWRFAALNDLAWLYTSAASPTPANVDQARAYSEESLRAQPSQQRALYNLGTITLDRNDEAKLLQARDYLQRSSRQPNWEDKPNPAMSAYIDYNLACACDGLAGFATAYPRRALLHECAGHLKRAAAKGAMPRDLFESVEADLATGDLSNLGHDADFAAAAGEIRALYQAAWSRLT
jgi:hypothetical protein